MDVEREEVDKGLAQLVLTLLELIRQLMERQALRRVERGVLTAEQEEQLGLTLMRLDEKMDELREIFELEKENINLDLGPLGNLL
ncbi:MAG: gas vesicle protein K [Desulforudis sp.]|nr:MAG: gas vesicle protein K [Desulforudis sp.]